MTTQFNSCATMWVDSRSAEEIAADEIESRKEQNKDDWDGIGRYYRALGFTGLSDKYKFWKEWYIWSDEDGGAQIVIDFPKLLEDWEYEIEKELQKRVKRFIRAQ